MIRMVFFALVIISLSCSKTEKISESPKSFLPSNSTFIPAADSFPFVSLKNTIDFDGKNIKLTYLDSTQMRRIIANCPGFSQKAFWIMHDWRVAFIAKQDTIGNYTPIIVSVGGTDYAALILILLDKDINPVSYLVLRGGECDGSDLCDRGESTIEKEKISTYRVRHVSEPDQNFQVIVDSISYQSVIQPIGKIFTKRLDSVRYVRRFILRN